MLVWSASCLWTWTFIKVGLLSVCESHPQQACQTHAQQGALCAACMRMVFASQVHQIDSKVWHALPKDPRSACSGLPAYTTMIDDDSPVHVGGT